MISISAIVIIMIIVEKGSGIGGAGPKGIRAWGTHYPRQDKKNAKLWNRKKSEPKEKIKE